MDNCTATANLTVTSTTGNIVGQNYNGTITRTYTITDDCGNYTNVDHVFNIFDNTPPTPLCKNISVDLDDATGNYVLTASQIDNGSSDNCGNVTLSIPPTNFTCADIGTNSVILTVTDANGNTNTCNATVTVTDNSTAASVSIQASPSTTVCADEDVTFSIFSISNAGTPNYTWLVNTGSGFSPAGNAATLTLNNPVANGTRVKLSITSNLFACPKESNTITMTVNSTVTPSVEIQVNDNTVCQGQSVIFSTIPAATLNMGANPSYQWYLNGSPTVTTSTYTGVFNNNDQVYLVMTPGPGVQCPNPNYDTSSTITMTVNNLPTVDAGPDQIICIGDSVTLSGSGANSYSWNNGVTNGVAFSPTTTTTYTVTGTDANGCINTDTVTVTVNPLPTVVASATDTNICEGDTITLTGSGATSYVWDSGVTNGLAFIPPVGTTTYTVTGTDANGCVDTDSITITVNPLLPPSVSISSSAASVCTGTNVSFTATPTNGGTNPTYQWYLNGGPVGTNSPNYSNAALTNGATVYVVMTPSSDICVSQPNATSNTLSTNVYTTPSAPVLINGPQGVCPPSYDIVYSVADNDPNVTSYTWTFPAGFTNIRISNNGTTATVNYTSNNIFNGNITVRANNICGTSSATNYPVSTDTFLFVDAGPDQYVCAGTTIVNLAGQIGGVIRRSNQWDWEALTPGGSFSNPDSTTSNYTLPGSVGPGGSVTIRIFSTVNNTNNTCSGDVEDFMTIYVLPNPTASFNSSPTTICQGDSTNIQFLGTANTTVTFSDGSSNHTVDLDGTGNGTFNTGTLSTTTTYNLVSVAYTNGNGCSQNISGNVQITVNPIPTVNAGVDQTICSNGSATMAASFGGGASNASWSSSGTGSFDNNNTNAIYTPSTLDISSGTVTLTYTTNDPAGPCTSVSDSMVLTINQVATVNAGVDQTICAGSTANMAGGFGGSASSGTWSSNGTGTFNNNNPNAIYTPSASDISSGTVTLTYTTNDPAGPCGSVSDFMVLTINPIATVTAGPDFTICSNETAPMAGGYGGGASSGTWSSSGSGSFSSNNPNTVYTPSANDINNGTVTLTYTTNDPSGPCGSVSDAMVLTIRDEIIITSQPQNVGICANNATSLSMVAIGDDLNYEWFHNGVSIGNNSNILNFPSAQVSDGGSYYVVVSSSIGECSQKTSNTVTLNVNEEIDIDVSGQPASGIRCEGDSYTFSVSASGAIQTYQWYFNGSPIFGATNDTLVLNNLTTANAGTYYVLLSGVGGTCPSVSSSTANLTVRPIPTVNVGSDQTICSNDTATMNATIGGSATAGTWSTSGSGSFNNNTFTNTIYNPSAADVTAGSVTLTFTVTNSVSPCLTGYSDSMVLTINPIPTVDAGTTIDVCQSSGPSPITLSGTSLGGGATTAAWSITSGGGTLSSTAQTANPNNITYTPASNFSGTVILTLTTNNPTGPCNAISDTRTINVSNEATVNAGLDQTICESGTAVMAATIGGSASSGTWTSSGTGSFNNNSTTAIYTPSASDITAGTVTLTYTTNDPNGPCPAVSDSMIVTIIPDLSNSLLDGFAYTQLTPPVEGPVSSQILACHQGDGILTLHIDPALIPYIVRWEYNNGSSFQTLPDDGNPDGNVLTRHFTGLVGTTSYRVVFSTGGTCGNAGYSSVAYVSVIPPDLKPEPVSASPTEFCFGGSSTMTASSNYGADQINSEGLFNTGQINTQDPDSWLVDGAVRGLSASGNDLKDNNWSGTNPHPITVGGNTTTWSSGEPKFAIAGGVLNQNQSNDPYYYEGGVAMTTLTTPIFSLMTIQDATFTFDEAFILSGANSCNGNSYPAGQAIIQISTNGGSTWSNIPDDQIADTSWRTGAVVTGTSPTPVNSGNLTQFNLNTTTVDLSSYFGNTDMRIRFVLVRNCESVWALDNIELPGANGVSTIEWTDQFGVFISNNNTINYQPITPGYQIYTVSTFINGCRSLDPDGHEHVPLTVDMAYAGQEQTVSSGCGQPAQLHAYDNTKGARANHLELLSSGNWVNGLYTVPTDPAFDYAPTGATGEWSITSGPSVVGINWATEDPANYFFPSVTDPRAEFAGPGGQYTLTWTVHGSGGDCSANVTINLTSCATLDFDGYDDNVTFRNDFDLNSGPFSIEIWVKPDPTQNSGQPNGAFQTILSKRDGGSLPTSYQNGYDLSLVGNKIYFNWNDGLSFTHSNTISTNRWYHVAVTFDGTNAYKMYIDGILLGSANGPAPINNNFECIMGAMDQAAAMGNPTPKYFYSGWLDELRIWNVELSKEQIRHMMNQEIVDNGGNVRGAVVPIDIPGPPAALTWANLRGYYRMNQPGDIANGYLLANAGARDGQMRNITTWQLQNSPLPYTTKANGNWYDTTSSTPWTHGDSVWDYPNALGIGADLVENTSRIDWNIVRTSHDVESDLTNTNPRDITLLGLILNPNSDLTITAQGTQDETNTGHGLWVTHYLKLDGFMNLIGESQLVQKRYTPTQVNESLLDVASAGSLKRDQQGTNNKFNYNYWSSPVGPINTTINNSPFSLGGNFRDGTTSSTPQTIGWTSSYDATGSVNPITLSRRWIYTYENKPANTYSEWVFKGETGTINVGLGYTLKGSGVGYMPNTIGTQNYSFIGKPHNNTISNVVSAGNDILVGNPYPSAIDADIFINENGPSGGTNSINGTLYFWDHYQSSNTHILADYEGGYAQYNFSGGNAAVTPPQTVDGIIIIGGTGTKIPGQYVPVGQGFFVTASGSGGQVTFNNSQRIFQRETNDNSSSGSQFFRMNDGSKTKEQSKAPKNDNIKRLRIQFKNPDGALRPLLLAFVPNGLATEGVDYGYDAFNYDNFPNDLSWRIKDQNYLIQGVGDFDKTKQYPLDMLLTKNGNVEISLTDLENFDTPINVYVYDALLGTYTKINNANFQMSLDANHYSNRFFIAFQQNGSTLSIEDIDDQTITVNYLSSTNEIYVKTINSIEIRQIYLINMIGQTVKSWNTTNLPMSNNEIRIPVSNISEGNYILKVETNGSTINKKVIIAN